MKGNRAMDREEILKKIEDAIYKRFGLHLCDINDAEDYFTKGFKNIDEYCEYLECKFDLDRIDEFIKGEDMDNENTINDMPIIFIYTRREALEDGVLVDVTELAKEASFVIPVAITAEVEAKILSISKEGEKFGQSRDGRLWDIIWMLRVAIMQDGEKSPGLIFFTVLVQNDNEPEAISLKAICGPRDDGKPVVTIMFPYED